MPKVIVILGPTAVGKTALSIELALRLNGEIISADSRQVYTGLDIGTGKVTPEEMQGVPHHLLDVANPDEVFSANDFLEQGRAAIAGILERGNVPIIVGGTGLYIDALLGTVGLAGVPADPAFRSRIAHYSLEELNTLLKELDPERAERIEKKNPVRLIRAIEIARSNPESWKLKPESPYKVLYIGLTLPRDMLKEKIHARLTARMEAGMLEEVKNLHKNGLSYERMESLGLEYRCMSRYLQDKLSYEEMMLKLEREIARYAKRQMTWFKRNKNITWFQPDENEHVFTLAKNFLAS